MAKGLRLPRAEDAVDGIRSTIRFLCATNEKIRALEAEDLVDERFVRKLEEEGRF